MERISTNGESYVKASTIARELGYTADYVGQLARSGAIDAQMVGRSWFVNEEALREHKRNRYRSSATKSKQAIEQAVHKTASAQRSGASTSKTFSYEPDTSDLVPVTRKPEGYTAPQSQQEVISRVDHELHTEDPAPEPTSEPQSELDTRSDDRSEADDHVVPIHRVAEAPSPARSNEHPLKKRPVPPHRRREAQNASESAVSAAPAPTPAAKQKRAEKPVLRPLALVMVLLLVSLVSATAVAGIEQRTVATAEQSGGEYVFNQASAIETGNSLKNMIISSIRAF